jgi:hypothetical protein
MAKDQDRDHDPEKEYIVDREINTALSRTEQYFLKMKKRLLGMRGRQDVLIDRRDPFRENHYTGEDRRKNSRDRRDS